MTMTDTEAKAMALVNEVQRERGLPIVKWYGRSYSTMHEALCRAIEREAATEARHAAELREQAERFEAFRQEVSDAVEAYLAHTRPWPDNSLRPFILPAPDPLVEVVNEAWGWRNPHPDVTENLRAALAARGGKIVWEAGE